MSNLHDNEEVDHLCISWLWRSIRLEAFGLSQARTVTDFDEYPATVCSWCAQRTIRFHQICIRTVFRRFQHYRVRVARAGCAYY